MSKKSLLHVRDIRRKMIIRVRYLRVRCQGEALVENEDHIRASAITGRVVDVTLTHIVFEQGLSIRLDRIVRVVSKERA